MKAVVVDLETLSKGEAAHILTIGAVCVDLERLQVVDRFYIAIADSGQDGREVDEDVVAWWESQKEENPKAYYYAFGERAEGKAVSLSAGLHSLSTWMEMCEKDIGGRLVFGNGPEFDNKILDHAFRQCGCDVPWKYRSNQSIRTMALVGNQFFGFDHYNMFFEGVKHYALDDAAHEAKVLLKVWSCLDKVAPKRLDDLEIGKTVWVYSDPRHVVVPENSPVWKCTITGWQVVSKVDADIGKREKSVQVFLDNGFSDFRKDLDDVFYSFDDAKKHACSEMAKLIEKSADWRGTLDEAMSALVEQKEDDE